MDRLETFLPRSARYAIRRRRLLDWMDDISERRRKALVNCKNPIDAEGIESQYYSETEIAADQLRNLTSRYLLSEARRLSIPTPKFDPKGGAWEESRVDPTRHDLTDTAIHELRAAIRAEKKAHRDAWLPWVAGLTGLVAALTGLFAVM